MSRLSLAELQRGRAALDAAAQEFGCADRLDGRRAMALLQQRSDARAVVGELYLPQRIELLFEGSCRAAFYSLAGEPLGGWATNATTAQLASSPAAEFAFPNEIGGFELELFSIGTAPWRSPIDWASYSARLAAAADAIALHGGVAGEQHPAQA